MSSYVPRKEKTAIWTHEFWKDLLLVNETCDILAL